MYPDSGIYTFFLLSAGVVMSFGAYRQCRVLGVSVKDSTVITGIFLSLALLGARMWHVIANVSLYHMHPEMIVDYDVKGFSLYGAIVLTGMSGLLVSRVRTIPLWRIADSMVPYLGVGIILARIGCFLEGCCFGSISRLPWAVQFPLMSDAHLYQLSRGQANLLTSTPVHPAQLYEAVGTAICVIVADVVQKKMRTAGIGILTFVAGYSTVRLVVHGSRIFPDTSSGIVPLLPAIYGIVAVFCLYQIRFKNRS